MIFNACQAIRKWEKTIKQEDDSEKVLSGSMVVVILLTMVSAVVFERPYFEIASMCILIAFVSYEWFSIYGPQSRNGRWWFKTVLFITLFSSSFFILTFHLDLPAAASGSAIMILATIFFRVTPH